MSDKRLPPEWFSGLIIVDAAEVKKMSAGQKVLEIGADRHGEKQTLHCTVVYSGKTKVLSYYDGYGYRITKPIRKTPNRVFAVIG